MSALAIDLVGFSALAEQLDPEDLRRTQLAFFSRVAADVLQVDGTVVKRIGDAVVALFGVPTAHANDALRAVYVGHTVLTALAEQDLVPGHRVLARAGVASGEVLVTFDAEGIEPRITGDVLMRAMALQRIAAPSQLLTGPTTYSAASAHFRFDGPLEIPGHDPSAGPFYAAAEALTVPEHVPDGSEMVGREPELSLLLNGARRLLVEGRGQVITLIGEPGLGKSRLTRALAEGLERMPVRPLFAYCHPYGAQASTSPLSQLVRRQAGVREADSAAVVSAKVRNVVQRLFPDSPETAALVVQELLASLGIFQDGGGITEDLAVVSAAWSAYLSALASDGPTVVVLEDLHWADDALLAVVREIALSTSEHPLMLVFTAHPDLPERHSDWLEGVSDAVTLTLTPLSDDHIATVLDNLLDGSPLPPALLARLLDRVGGNPLYAEEYGRMIADSGVLDRAEAVATYTQEEALGLLTGLPLPDTLHGVISSRLEHFPLRQRTVLTAAAALGRNFWEGGIEAITHLDLSTVRGELAALVGRSVINPSRHSSLPGQQEYSFRHMLIRDAFYARLPRSVRLEHHLAVAEWLKSLHLDPRDTSALLAHHLLAAFELAAETGLDVTTYATQARAALVEASRQALRSHAVSRAQAYAAQAIVLSPEGDTSPEQLRLRLHLARLNFLEDQHAFYQAAGEQEIASLIELLVASGDNVNAARAEALAGQVEWFRGAGPAVIGGHLERAVALLAGQPASRHTATALLELGRFRLRNHEYADAVALCDRAHSIAHQLHLPELEALALTIGGSARYHLDDPLGIRQQEQAVALCRRHGFRSLQHAATDLASTRQEQGRLHESFELHAEAAEAARGWRLSLTSRHQDAAAALRAWCEGDWADMLGHVDRYLDLVSPEAQHWETFLLSLACVVYGLRGEPVPDHLAAAVDRALTKGFPGPVQSAQLALAAARMLHGRPQAAADLLDEFLDAPSEFLRPHTREWTGLAVLLSAELGQGRLTRVRKKMQESTPRTPWLEAADHLAAAYLLSAHGKHVDALEASRTALMTYESVGDLSTAFLTRLQVLRRAEAADDQEALEEHFPAFEEFLERNAATALLPFVPAKR